MSEITQTQVKSFYKNGFLVLKNIIPKDIVIQAKHNIDISLEEFNNQVKNYNNQNFNSFLYQKYINNNNPLFLDLFNKSDLKNIIEFMLGDLVSPIKKLQFAINFPEAPSSRTNESGYYDHETPFYGWCGHLDGLWNGGTLPPRIGEIMTNNELLQWNKEISTNGVKKRCIELNCNIFNFSALVGIPLSDQIKDGDGNVGVLKGAHHKMENFFKMQFKAGGPIGPDGPGWQRENTSAPNGHGLNHYPDSVRESFKRNAVRTSDGRLWPKPTLIQAKQADAILIHFTLPHSATRVVGPDPRMMLYYRISPQSRPKKYLKAFPQGLYDIWNEWKGLKEIINSL